MLDDLQFSSSRPSPFVEYPHVRVPSCSKTGRRRPAPPLTQRASPWLADIKPAQQWLPDTSAAFLGAPSIFDESDSSAEAARLRRTVAELTARCERQVSELERTRVAAEETSERNSDATVREASSPKDGSSQRRRQRKLQRELSESACTPRSRAAPCAAFNVASSFKDGSTQTEVDPGMADTFAEQGRQLDAVHRESGQRGRELRRAQETARTLRAELKQEKSLVEQYQAQIDALEAELRSATARQKKAEEERAVADWRLRAAQNQLGSSMSRSATPMLSSHRVRTCWAEGPGETSESNATRLEAGLESVAGGPCISVGSLSSSGSHTRSLSDRASARDPAPQRDVTERCPSVMGAAEMAMCGSSDEDSDSEEVAVFHPPPVGPKRYTKVGTPPMPGR